MSVTTISEKCGNLRDEDAQQQIEVHIRVKPFGTNVSIVPLSEYEKLRNQKEKNCRKLQKFTKFVRYVFQGSLPPYRQPSARKGRPTKYYGCVCVLLEGG